jgi:hypothetical protein
MAKVWRVKRYPGQNDYILGYVDSAASEFRTRNCLCEMVKTRFCRSGAMRGARAMDGPSWADRVVDQVRTGVKERGELGEQE